MASKVFCIHCAHYPDFGYFERNCGHADSRVINLVTGSHEVVTCTEARKPGQACGPDGNLFKSAVIND